MKKWRDDYLLPLRLQQIINMLLPYQSVADIGTDHALLPCYLALHPFWQGVEIIGIDFSPVPLKEGKKNVEAFGLENSVQLRKGWGLNPLGKKEVEQVVISGLGGKKIASIMEKSRENNKDIKHFYLQPHRDIFFLRKWLVEKGWAIINEEIAEEKGNYYFAIRAERGIGQRKLFDWELEIGPILILKKPPLLANYLEGKVQEFNTILEKIRSRKPGHSSENYWEEKIEFYKGVKEWLFPQEKFLKN